MKAISNLLGACFKREEGRSNAAPDTQASSTPAIRMNAVIKNTANRKTPTPGLNYFQEIIGGRRSGGQAIDLGSGGGRDSKVLAANGWTVTAVDPLQSAGEAVANRENINFVHGRIFDIDLLPGTVHLINSQRVVPFMSNDELHEMLCRAATLLAPDGHLNISFFDERHSWASDSRHATKHFHDDGAIRDALEQAGLQLTATKHHMGAKRAANGEMVDNNHEILVITRRLPEVKSDGIAARLRKELTAVPSASCLNLFIVLPHNLQDYSPPTQPDITVTSTPPILTL